MFRFVEKSLSTRFFSSSSFVPSKSNILIDVTKQPIQLGSITTWCRTEGYMFCHIHTIASKKNTVKSIIYQTEEVLIRQQMFLLCNDILNKFHGHKIAMIQRVGEVQVGDIGMICCISSAQPMKFVLPFLVENYHRRLPITSTEMYQ